MFFFFFCWEWVFRANERARIYLETYSGCSLEIVSRVWKQLGIEPKKSEEATSKTVTGNILKVMVSKLLLNEIRHIKMSGSLLLFIALGWFYVAFIRRKSNNSPGVFFLSFLVSHLCCIHLPVIAGNWIICTQYTDRYFWKLFLSPPLPLDPDDM